MTLLQSRTATALTPAEQYDALAVASARLVIRRYSTSFGIASRFLAEPVRTHVQNIYALVRVADELVDAPRPGADDAERQRLLDLLEQEVLEAMGRGHSANLVVHAFARTARGCGIEPELVTPFFASMRTDLLRTEHDRASFDTYVYGSAEVVGLMCLKAFVHELPDRDQTYDVLAPGARRLGAAFQKVNFLRDLAMDHGQLGRSYFPGIDPSRLTEAQRNALLDDIDDDLHAAAVAMVGLPAGSQSAVRLAHGLFEELSRRLREAPLEQVRTERIRVPGPVKARIVGRELLRRSA
jgi:phytoene/squalene synthetase